MKTHESQLYSDFTYGVALASRTDKIIGFFCKRALQKRRYFAKETYNFIDPTDRSHPIVNCIAMSHSKKKILEKKLRQITQVTNRLLLKCCQKFSKVSSKVTLNSLYRESALK